MGRNGDPMKGPYRMSPPSLASVILAFAGGLVGVWAAYYWLKASQIEVDPGWRSGIPESAAEARKPIEPVDRELADALWISAIIKAGGESAGLNKRAALLTAIAVVLGAVASILGGMAGWVR
jgi:hypothetical protein